MAEINVKKLHQELKTANIVISGCDSNGVVWDKLGKQIQDRADVLAILGAHDPKLPLIEARQEKYLDVGVNSKTMLFALWKKIMRSDSTDADALQSLMDGIDALLN